MAMHLPHCPALEYLVRVVMCLLAWVYHTCYILMPGLNTLALIYPHFLEGHVAVYE